MRRTTAILASATIIVALLAVPAAAAQKTGCPSGTGWGQWTVEDAADRIWPALIDPDGVFPGGFADLVVALEGYDHNGDGSICLKIMWGDDLNPNSHWYRFGVDLLGTPVEQFLLRDNNSSD